MRVGRTISRPAVGFLALALACAALHAQAAPALGQTTRLNYVNADIRDVIRSLATVMGVNVLLSEEVPSKRVTYTTPRAVPVGEVGAVLEAILESEGLVLIQRGPVAEVLPAERAPATGPVFIGKELPSPRPLGLITQIVPLQSISADEALAVLEQLAGSLARIEIVPRSNSLLITDAATNVERYLELLRELDVVSDGEGGLRTYVYRLKHANGPDLAMTLGQTFGVTVAQVQTPTRTASLQDRSLTSTLESFRQRELQSLEQRRTTPIPLQLQAPLDTAGALPEEVSGLVGRTTIVPDLATNSLVIRTAPPNYPVLRETIEALDIRPAQVLLEVLIAEITLDSETRYGINWSIFAEDKIDGETGDAEARLGRELDDETVAGIDQFVARVVRLNSIDVRAVLTALATDADVNVLATPHVTALNNEEARIFVGSEVPFNQSSRIGLDVVVDQTVQYKNVGNQLTIVPTINEDGYVSFRILQEISDLTTLTVEAALGAPIITVREAETSALVRNGQTVVIGGLIDESTEEVESGVPFLKDIPILGYLFKSETTRNVRTELAIFVTPFVVFTDEDAARLLEREQNRLQNAEDVRQQLQPPPDSGQGDR